MRPIARNDLHRVLRYLLASEEGEQLAGEGQVRGFLNYLRESGTGWVGWWEAGVEPPRAMVVALILAGRTGMLLLPPVGRFGNDPAAQAALCGEALGELRARDLHYVQGLIESGSSVTRDLLRSVGFTSLAPLAYLERPVSGDEPRARTDAGIDWVAFSPATYGRFADVLQETYENSLDCPELNGLRPVEDIIAAHQASGQFRPEWWELVHVDGEDLGCLLLGSHARGMSAEVVYMGVSHRSRGRGLGRAILHRALAHCRAAGTQTLTLAVDERNGPACRLYDAFGFRCVARRDAWLYVW